MDGYGQGINGFKLLLVLKMKVKIEDIKFVKELYPRFELDNYTVNQYRQSIDSLPPILISKNYVLVDGYHRLVAHRIEGLAEIEVEFFDSEDEAEIFLEAIRRNSIHGKQLSIEEKKRLAPILFKKGISIEKIINILAVKKSIVYEWTEKERANERETRDAEILELYLQCWTQKQIAEKLGIDHRTVGITLGKISIDGKIPTPDNLQFYNVWSVGKLNLDQMKYPGQTPQEIVENIVYYYSDPPRTEPELKISKICDPMAGSGITREVCRKLLRRYILFDINPIREDIPIKKNDILQGFPDNIKDIDLVYFDPPYFNLLSEYPDNKFTKTYETFIEAMEISLKNILKILKQNGKVALILKPMNEKMLEGEWLDLTFDCITIAKRLGYKLEKRICAPLTAQQFNAPDMVRAKEHRIMLNTLRDIVILQKE